MRARHNLVGRPTQLLPIFNLSLSIPTYKYNRHAWQDNLLIIFFTSLCRSKPDSNLDWMPPAWQWKSILFRPPAEQSFTNEDAQSSWTGRWICLKPTLLFLLILTPYCSFGSSYTSAKTFHKYLFTKSDKDGHADDNVGSERRGSINDLQFPALRATSSSLS